MNENSTAARMEALVRRIAAYTHQDDVPGRDLTEAAAIVAELDARSVNVERSLDSGRGQTFSAQTTPAYAPEPDSLAARERFLRELDTQLVSTASSPTDTRGGFVVVEHFDPIHRHDYDGEVERLRKALKAAQKWMCETPPIGTPGTISATRAIDVAFSPNAITDDGARGQA